VLSGEVFDVAVDIRKGSPTYGRWVSARLSGDNGNMLYVPSGFAHGFCVLSEDAEIFYYCSEEYAPELERNILWNDPCLAITWPVSTPLLSPKDANGSSLAEAENNFEYKRPLL
jgi:dTDP-4-dehydrorhamnose 3,5-epimerase